MQLFCILKIDFQRFIFLLRHVSEVFYLNYFRAIINVEKHEHDIELTSAISFMEQYLRNTRVVLDRNIIHTCCYRYYSVSRIFPLYRLNASKRKRTSITLFKRHLKCFNEIL